MRVHPVIKRLIGLVAVVLGVTMVTFIISRLIPGDPAQMLAGPRASAEAIARIRDTLGLDQPMLIQYGRYLADLLRGDFGTSIVTGRSVGADLAAVFPATIELVLVALALSTTAGIMLGTLAAVFREGPFDYAVRLVASASISMPSFWLALVMLLLFYGQFDLLPGDERIGVDFDPPPTVTGFFLVDALTTGDFRLFCDVLRHLALPAATLALVSVGSMIRVSRTAMIEVLHQDYIRTAVAGGLSWGQVVFNHALRNALVPVVTLLGMEAAGLLFGAVIVESVFVWPGAGSYVLNAIFTLDFPVIMGFTVIVSVAYVMINALTDLAYRWLNPRMAEVG
ncbi:ABC transporter permease [Niveispirillum fermenti]|uniref:ABC transporter permease n=1 Tax=Niveispirillum fermenti TaxID=1233113 RepID=UPI003A8A6D23